METIMAAETRLLTWNSRETPRFLPRMAECYYQVDNESAPLAVSIPIRLRAIPDGAFPIGSQLTRPLRAALSSIWLAECKLF
jgi:hypothetical protein